MGKGNNSKKSTRHSTRIPKPTTDYKQYKEYIQQRRMKKENGNLVSMFKGLSVRPSSKRHTMKDLTKSFGSFNMKKSKPSTSSGNWLHGFNKLKLKGGNKTKRRNNKRSRRSLKKR